MTQKQTLRTRWIKHWQALPARNRVGAALSLAALIVILFALALQIRDLVAGVHEAAPTPTPTEPTPTPADPAALRKPSGAAPRGTGFFSFANGGNDS